MPKIGVVVPFVSNTAYNMNAIFLNGRIQRLTVCDSSCSCELRAIPSWKVVTRLESLCSTVIFFRLDVFKVSSRSEYSVHAKHVTKLYSGTKYFWHDKGAWNKISSELELSQISIAHNIQSQPKKQVHSQDARYETRKVVSHSTNQATIPPSMAFRYRLHHKMSNDCRNVSPNETTWDLHLTFLLTLSFSAATNSMREFRRRRPNAPKRTAKRFPFVAKRMEQWFYLQAFSKQQYTDLSTLTPRMERFASVVMERARRLRLHGASGRLGSSPRCPP